MSEQPDHPAAAFRASPNHGERRDGKRPDILLLHYTGMETGEAAEDWLCNPESGVSCHYIVHEDGRIIQMVPEERRAWHAGASCWQGETDINSRSIGIEIVNGGHAAGCPDYPAVQLDSVLSLSKDIMARHAIAPQRVLGHSDVAPGRKADPGEHFPWPLFAAAGVGLAVEPAPVGGGRFFEMGSSGQPVEALQAMLALFGYNTPVDGSFGQQTRDVVEAFQRHFRPQRVDGVADRSTIETLNAALRRLPALA